MSNEIKQYLSLLGETPSFLEKYKELDFMKRLKYVGYFCGMDYASKSVYDFPFYISRFDHSLTTAMMTFRYTKRKEETLAALFHDAGTPSFSHVIDYMNGDFVNQESTEEKTEEILKNSNDLLTFLKEDKIDLERIIDFKKYSIVDAERPRLCADRLDGIILTSLAWTKALTISEVAEILKYTGVFLNEEEKLEIGFTRNEVGERVLNLNEQIDQHCHQNYDSYMMMLLAELTKRIIEKGIIKYEDLYVLDESVVMSIFHKYAEVDPIFKEMLIRFKTIKLESIPQIEMPALKKRVINPLVNGIRYLK